jgi:ketosteroid isomerase-like protein/enterochelin esterase-like enzyme
MKRFQPIVFFLLIVVATDAVAQQQLATTSVISRNARETKLSSQTQSNPSAGLIETVKFTSSILKENLIGLDTNRSAVVYLPPSYKSTRKKYPVVYYLHNFNWSPEQMVLNNNFAALLDKAFSSRVSEEFIFVVANYTSPTGGSLYGNSPVSGKWLSYTTEEVIPLIDKKYRTINDRNSRGIVGDFFGGYGALKLSMTRADLFGAVYAMHPVATGGYMPWHAIQIDWKKVLNAKSFDQLSPGRERIFVSIAQNFLPNPNRPPFYCDFPFELENNEPKYNVENTLKTQTNFHLDRSLEQSVENLRKMNGIAIDWARYDPVQDHLHSVDVLSRRLDDFGIEHEAEEYRGSPYNKVWTEDGRFAERVVPFFFKHLKFDAGLSKKGKVKSLPESAIAEAGEKENQKAFNAKDAKDAKERRGSEKGKVKSLPDSSLAEAGENQEIIQNLNDILREAYVSNNANAVLPFYTNDAIYFPEYKQAILDKSALNDFFRSWFSNVDIKSYSKKIYFIENLGDHVIEIGKFNMTFTFNSDSLRTYAGNYLVEWKRNNDNTLSIASETFGSDSYVKADQVPYGAIEVPQPSYNRNPDVSNDVLNETQKYDSIVLKSIAEGDTKMRIAGFAEDAIVMRNFDSMRIGVDNFRETLTRTYHPKSTYKVQHTYSRIVDLGNFILMNGYYKGGSTDPGRNMSFKGKMTNILKRTSTGELVMYRQIVNLDN